MKIRYGTKIDKYKDESDIDRAFYLKVLLTDAARTLARATKITLPLVITISEDHNSMQWYAEMEE